MAGNKNSIQTIFRTLDGVLNGNWGATAAPSNVKQVNNYSLGRGSDDILLRTRNKEEFERTKLQAQQDKYLASMWVKANKDIELTNLSGLTNVKLMYRDVELMDSFPEIGAALDTYMAESTTLNDKGEMLNIYSRSERVKNILEDLFVNRLQIHITLPLITRSLCKYGNDFQLLNMNSKEGVLGWRQLPIYEMERYESEYMNPYTNAIIDNDNAVDKTRFIWVGKNEMNPYRSWQVAHFRLLTDHLFLPFGVSVCNKARRHWRILSMMEDMMLIYRLERSIERRIYKVFVGDINDKDVPAYIQEVANNFKRTPIIDPQTGQVDLRKNLLGVDQDIFLPFRGDESRMSKIDTLPPASNLDKIEDLKYVQNKVFTALGVPRNFINFEQTEGDGKSLALMDIRFARKIVAVQQALIMELSKIATVHLFLLGLHDDLNNFTITMNNPSTQAEMLRIENLQTKVTLASNLLSDPGNGIQMMSWVRVMKQIFNMSDAEAAENLKEIRLERGLAAELKKTDQIIKRTGVFDPVDKIYGEPGAEYMEGEGFDEEGGGGASPSFGGGGGSMSMSDFETSGGEEGEISPEEASAQQGEETGEAAPETPKTENKSRRGKKIIVENNNYFLNNYIKRIESNIDNDNHFKPNIISEAIIGNEDITNMVNEIDEYLKSEKEDTPQEKRIL